MGAKTTDIYMIQALLLSTNVGEDFTYRYLYLRTDVGSVTVLFCVKTVVAVSYSVLRNRNSFYGSGSDFCPDKLRSRFRLLISYGTGSVSGPVSRPSTHSLKKLEKILPFLQGQN